MTHPVPGAGPEALAIAVYASGDDTLPPAADKGYEGVACVDDAARALELVSELYVRTRQPWALRWARGLMEFLLWMEAEPGRWHNFITGWDGTRNEEGPTSYSGSTFWTARAWLALARCAQNMHDDRASAAALRALAVARDSKVAPDVRCIQILALLCMGAQADPGRKLLARWANEIKVLERDGICLNYPEEELPPHIWGHIQEGVLALCSEILNDRSMLALAASSADKLIRPLIEGNFSLPSVQPYSVACTIFSCQQLERATHDPVYGMLVKKAQAWFDGPDPSMPAIYDRRLGRVADGVDNGRVNAGSGAESNIMAGLALIDELETTCTAMGLDALLPAVASATPPA